MCTSVWLPRITSTRRQRRSASPQASVRRAFVEFLWNYEVVATVHASDLNDFNTFHQFEAIVHGNDSLPMDQLMIRSGGTDTTAQGLAIDHIVLQEWIV